MNYIKISLVFILWASFSFAQTPHNKLLGEFKTIKKNTLYTSFVFDNNGKVMIDEGVSAYYFVEADSVFVFLDKDVFKFNLKNDLLKGASDWVENASWKKTNIKVEDKRTSEQWATQNALLLQEYYQKTRKHNQQLSYLFDEKAREEYEKTINQLCEKQLPIACREKFGLMILKESGGLEAALNLEKRKPIEVSPKITDFINNVEKFAPDEAANMKSLYEMMISNVENIED